jgi:Flp pilus assembly protein TadD
MSIIRLKHQADDDAALLFRLQHVIAGAIRFARPKLVHVVKLDNWFGARWLRFAGKVKGRDLRPDERLAVPPFAPGRVVREVSYRRQGDELRRVKARRLHESAIAPSAAPIWLDAHAPSGIFIWYSGKTASQDRGSLMVYEVEKDAEQRGWYAELRQREGVWSVSSAIGTSVNEINELETAYGNRLAPLFPPEDRDQDQALWEQALDAVYGSEVAYAAVLIDEFKSRHPDNLLIRLLHARSLVQRRLCERAEAELRAIERGFEEAGRRPIWVTEWAYLCQARGDMIRLEDAHRELASLEPEKTSGWILLGGTLATQGKLEEAEAVHRHAAELRGDRDEAYLNLGYVLRAMGRLEEAASAFESALELCPDYPEAARGLADVRRAMERRDGRKDR